MTDGYEALYRSMLEPGQLPMVEDHAAGADVTRLDAARGAGRDETARRTAVASGQ